jgi:hypothetical protein
MRTFKFTLTRRGSRVHHAKRYTISEEEFGGPIHRLDVMKHYMKGDMLVVKTLLNGVDKIKIILLNVVPEDKIEVVFQMGKWRLFIDKTFDVGCFSVLLSSIDDEDHEAIVERLFKRKFLSVMCSRFDDGDDDGYLSDPDTINVESYNLFY